MWPAGASSAERHESVKGQLHSERLHIPRCDALEIRQPSPGSPSTLPFRGGPLAEWIHTLGQQRQALPRDTAPARPRSGGPHRIRPPPGTRFLPTTSRATLLRQNEDRSHRYERVLRTGCCARGAALEEPPFVETRASGPQSPGSRRNATRPAEPRGAQLQAWAFTAGAPRHRWSGRPASDPQRPARAAKDDPDRAPAASTPRVVTTTPLRHPVPGYHEWYRRRPSGVRPARPGPVGGAPGRKHCRGSFGAALQDGL